MTDKKQASFITITSFLKGIGQIMLQNNAWTGLFFLAGIFCGSLIMGAAALLAVIAGTLTAKLFKYNEDEVNTGLYGFSATLVGVALVVYFQPTPITWLAIIPGSILATVIQHFFITKKIPVYTLPFILVTWAFLFMQCHSHLLSEPEPAATGTMISNIFTVLPRGFGQVIFQGNILAGVLFFIGVFIGRPVAAMYAVTGVFLSSVIAYLLGSSLPDIYMGLLSYNAVLCAITFSGKKLNDIVFAIVSVVLSVLIDIQMSKMRLPVLTFPFVLATWLTLIIRFVLRPKTKPSTSF